MLFYSILFPIIAVIAIVLFFLRYLHGKNSFGTLILWTIFWILVSFFAINPPASNHFAKLLGITRGLDFVIIIVFVLLFYSLIKLFLKVDELQDDLNKMVKQITLDNEITLDDEEE